MGKLEKLIKEYYHHDFEDWGSCTSEEYRAFEKAYWKALKEIGGEIGMDLYKFNRNHYEFSAVMVDPKDDRYYYISISDVRYFKDEWFDNVLYRTMAHSEDWSGGGNHYCRLDQLGEKLSELRERTSK